jgi:hypothetical protein
MDRGLFSVKRVYGLRHGSKERDEHALALRHGLALLGPGFVCSLCWRCKGRCIDPSGHGEYACDYCNGTGLLQGDDNIRLMPAFDSQRNQVLVAASRSIILPFEVCIC